MSTSQTFFREVSTDSNASDASVRTRRFDILCRVVKTFATFNFEWPLSMLRRVQTEPFVVPQHKKAIADYLSLIDKVLTAKLELEDCASIEALYRTQFAAHICELVECVRNIVSMHVYQAKAADYRREAVAAFIGTEADALRPTSSSR